jgi:anti-sigma factor RsiW
MTWEEQLKLQAWLDGELPPDQAGEMSVRAARDPAAAALVAELQQTRQQLRSGESSPALPESREFYWAKIERAIQRSAAPTRVRAEPGLLGKLRLLILPTAAAAVLTVLIWAGHFFPAPMAPAKTAEADTPAVETALASMNATTYRDAREGTTLVWFTDTPRTARAATPGPGGPN